MNAPGQADNISPGFTLIELLMVIGLIVFLVGGFGLALRGTSENALRSARYQVAGLLERARLVAASQQSDTRLVISVTGSDRLMRLLQVFYRNMAGNWTTASPALWLPRGVSVVPPAALDAIDHALVGYSGARSTLAIDNAPNLPAGDFEGASWIGYIEYGPDGRIRSPGDDSVVIAIAAVGSAEEQDARLAPARVITVARNGAILFETEGIR